MARAKGGRKGTRKPKSGSSRKPAKRKGKTKYVTHTEFNNYKKHVEHRFEKVEGYIIRIVDVIRRTNKQKPVHTMKDSPAQAVPNKIKMN
jgi:hypothetical protein